MAYGTLAVDTLNSSTGVLATQNGMTGIAKAWVTFTNSSGTLTINGSFNVSSLTYRSTGTIGINFTTAMANSNYALTGTCVTTGTASGVVVIKRSTSTTTATDVETVNLTTPLANLTDNSILIFGA